MYINPKLYTTWTFHKTIREDGIKIARILEAVQEIREKSKNFSKNARDLLSELHQYVNEVLTQLISRNDWVIELTQITDKNTGDARERKWFVSSWDEIENQELYRNRDGTAPRLYITVRDPREKFDDPEGFIIFSGWYEEIRFFAYE